MHLELVRSARARRNSKWRGDMVSKGAVVCMLLDGHELDSIVT